MIPMSFVHDLIFVRQCLGDPEFLYIYIEKILCLKLLPRLSNHLNGMLWLALFHVIKLGYRVFSSLPVIALVVIL